MVLHELRELWGDATWSPIDIAQRAVWGGHRRVLRDLLARGLVTIADGSPERDDWMRSAASNSDVSMIKDLLAYGLDVHPGPAGVTPLMSVCHQPFGNFTDTRLETVQLLLREGCEVDACSTYGRTALDFVVMDEIDTEDIDVIRILLNAGADPREGTFLATIESHAGFAAPEMREELLELTRECHAVADRLDR